MGNSEVNIATKVLRKEGGDIGSEMGIKIFESSRSR